jgi:hypothetical protein
LINIACLIDGCTSKQDFSRLILYSDDDCGLETGFVCSAATGKEAVGWVALFAKPIKV